MTCDHAGNGPRPVNASSRPGASTPARPCGTSTAWSGPIHRFPKSLIRTCRALDWRDPHPSPASEHQPAGRHGRHRAPGCRYWPAPRRSTLSAAPPGPPGADARSLMATPSALAGHRGVSPSQDHYLAGPLARTRRPGGTRIPGAATASPRLLRQHGPPALTGTGGPWCLAPPASSGRAGPGRVRPRHHYETTISRLGECNWSPAGALHQTDENDGDTVRCRRGHSAMVAAI